MAAALSHWDYWVCLLASRTQQESAWYNVLNLKGWVVSIAEFWLQALPGSVKWNPLSLTKAPLTWNATHFSIWSFLCQLCLPAIPKPPEHSSPGPAPLLHLIQPQTSWRQPTQSCSSLLPLNTSHQIAGRSATWLNSHTLSHPSALPWPLHPSVLEAGPGTALPAAHPDSPVA